MRALSLFPVPSSTFTPHCPYLPELERARPPQGSWDADGKGEPQENGHWVGTQQCLPYEGNPKSGQRGCQLLFNPLFLNVIVLNH